MREIKFRTWDTEDKTMASWDETAFQPDVYTRHGHDDMPEHIHLSHVFEGLKTHGGIIFMQYIGLKDADGKEIYEGDILGPATTPANIPNPRTVIYSENWGAFMLEDSFIDKDSEEPTVYPLVKDENFLNYLEDDNTEPANNYKIIGNIYENPELLK